MTRNYSIDRLAAATARQAQSESAIMQRDLRALRDSIAGLTRAIKAPQPSRGSRIIKGSKTTSPWEGIAGIGLALLGDAGLFGDEDIKVGGKVNIGGFSYSQSYSSTGNSDGGSFYTSAAQAASATYNSMLDGQRIR